MEERIDLISVASLELRGKRIAFQDATSWKEAMHNGVKRLACAIADGHGEGGDKAATFAAMGIVNDLVAEPTLDAPLITEQFCLLHDAITREMPRGVGTTLTVAVREGNRLTTAYVGDSEVWLFKNGKLMRRTVPHRYGDHRGEMMRLQRSPAQIDTRGNITVVSHEPYANESGIARSQVTRSLGDIEFAPYVSHDPQVETILLEGTETFLLLGTDGFWDAATLRSRSRHAIEHVLASATSAEEARQKFLEILARRDINDNATALIIKL